MLDLVQTATYLVFMLCLACFVGTLRTPEEFFVSKRINDRLLGDAVNDAAQISDIYIWGQEKLLPELLPEFGLDGETNPTVEELLYELDSADWSSGILIRQVRAPARQSTNQRKIRAPASSTEDSQCAMVEAPNCYRDILADRTPADTEPFGFNYSHPGQPLSRPFVYQTAEQLGTRPLTSANVASFRAIPAGGYVAFIIPFFSDVFLPEQRGAPSEVIDFRRHSIAGFYRDAGWFNCSTPACAPAYFCVRLSQNGRDIHQLCDANDGPPDARRTTGSVRRAALAFWRELRRARFIDRATRALSVSFQIDANLAGVTSFTTVLFELTAAGSVLTSVDMAVSPNRIDDTVAYGRFSLAAFCAYQLFELHELYRIGFRSYLGSLYNVIDVVSLALFLIISHKLAALAENAHDWVPSELWDRAGFLYTFDYPHACVSLRTWLAVLLCLQVLKTTRFFVALAPNRFGLANRVLAAAMVDLFAFGTYFLLSLCAFAMLFFVQLGSRMPDFNGAVSSLLTLARALFGDFDIAEIISVSSGLTNATLFLVYLFVAVFVLLSMFLAILGEAQETVRAEEKRKQEEGAIKDGVLDEVLEHVLHCQSRA